MYETFLRKDIITILPMELTFHFSIKISEYIKMTDELMRLNYSHYSPYPNPEIISYYDGTLLHLWFYKRKIKSLFIIPEAFILFQELRDNFSNDVVIVHDDLYKIFLIKEKQLLKAQVFKKYDEQIVKLIMDEYNITNLSNTKDLKSSELLKNIHFLKMLKWKNPSIKFKSVISSMLDTLAYPIAFFFFSIMIAQFLYGYQLSSEVENLQNKYIALKEKNKKIKKYIKTRKYLQNRWNSFLTKELIYPDVMIVLETIVDILPADKVNIRHINIIGDEVLVTLESNENPIIMLNKFVDMKLFENVIIKRSFNQKKWKKVIVYQMNLLPIKGR